MQGSYLPAHGMPDYHALLMIDVDHFKAVNDNYGHLCGDSVHSDVAAALKGNVRSGDLVGRIGGDEFLIYFPEVTDPSHIHHKAEQILQALSYIRPEPGAHTITCSIGVAVLSRCQNDYGSIRRRTAHSTAAKTAVEMDLPSINRKEKRRDLASLLPWEIPLFPMREMLSMNGFLNMHSAHCMGQRTQKPPLTGSLKSLAAPLM